MIRQFGSLVAVVLTLCVLNSCSTQRKAEKFYKKHPVELAKACAEKYPVKDSIIKGDSVVVYDTLWGLETRIDTLTAEPIVITKTVEKQVPKLVTKVVTLHDTIVRENTAKTAVLNSQIAKLELDKKELTVKLQLAEDSRDEWRKRFFILLGIVILYAGLKIYSKFGKFPIKL